MPTPSFTALAPEYAADWARMTIDPDRLVTVDKAARRIAAARWRYEPVAAATRVPWFVIGLLHLRESGMDFSTHLHNGDTLTRRTRQVPAGRPVAGEPPFSWEESAIDALRYDRLDRVGSWPIEVICYRAEGYNGFGPRWRGRKSGYLWAGSTVYDGGKYVADGKWDPSAWDRQLGVLPVLRRLIDLGLAALDAPALPSPDDTAARRRTPEALQTALNRLLIATPGFEPLDVDGSIGRATRAAVRLFQARAGLDDDGVAGLLTWAAIDERLDASPATGG